MKPYDPLFREIYDKYFLINILENRKLKDTSGMEFIYIWAEEQMRNISIADLSERKHLDAKTLEKFDDNNLVVSSDYSSFNTIRFLDNLESLIMHIAELKGNNKQEQQKELEKILSNQSRGIINHNSILY